MIAVNINAGLANQMFHYAFGRGLIAKGYDVVFDQVNFKPRKEWSFENVQLQDAFPNIEINQMPKGHFKWVVTEHNTKSNWKKRLAQYIIKIHNILDDERYIFESQYGFCPNIEKQISKNCIFRGCWQSEKYFAHCEEDIRKQFVFLPFDEEKNIFIAYKMAKENSVSIHLRKGKDN